MSQTSKNHYIREKTSLVDILIWVYQRQKADQVSKTSLWSPYQNSQWQLEVGRKSSGCGCARLLAIHQTGIYATAEGQHYQGDLHPDAERLHDAMIAFSQQDWQAAALLQRYAARAEYPEYFQGVQVFVPLYDDHDKIIQDRYDEVILKKGKKAHSIPILYCPVELYPATSWVEMINMEYTLWQSSLRRFMIFLGEIDLIRWEIVELGIASAMDPQEDQPNA